MPVAIEVVEFNRYHHRRSSPVCGIEQRIRPSMRHTRPIRTIKSLSTCALSVRHQSIGSEWWCPVPSRVGQLHGLTNRVSQMHWLPTSVRPIRHESGKLTKPQIACVPGKAPATDFRFWGKESAGPTCRTPAAQSPACILRQVQSAPSFCACHGHRL